MVAVNDMDLHDFKLKVSGALCRCKRRMSFKTLQLGTPFSCHFLGLRPLKNCVKYGFLWFLELPSTVLFNNCSDCRLIPVHGRARPETKPISFRFPRLFSKKAYSRCYNSRLGRTHSPAPTSKIRPTRTSSRTSRSTSPPRPPPS